MKRDFAFVYWEKNSTITHICCEKEAYIVIFLEGFSLSQQCAYHVDKNVISVYLESQFALLYVKEKLKEKKKFIGEKYLSLVNKAV